MTSYYAALEQEALLHIEGPDALSFLQGQVTCDTRTLAPQLALPGVYCTVQGRVACDFLLIQLAGEHLALRMRRDIREASAALLAKYIIFSKAELDAQQNDWRVFGCWGAQAGSQLLEIFGANPAARYASCSGEGFALVQLDDGGEQYECYLDSETRPDLLARLESTLQPGVQPEWDALQIASGIARIGAATAGEFVPQMLNYDLTGHISFNKGCYTGQEVVARLHYRGKAKRRLYPASQAAGNWSDRTLPAAGSPLYRSGSEQAAGNIVNSAINAQGQLVALVTATKEGVASGLKLDSAEEATLQTGQLPYPVAEK